jgi:hypothetical protein
MDHPINPRYRIPPSRAALFYCIDKRSEIACRDFPRRSCRELLSKNNPNS